MPFNTKNILRDLGQLPIPQLFDVTDDQFQPLTGAALGNSRYGSDGIMWGKTAGGVYLPVQVDANGRVQTGSQALNSIGASGALQAAVSATGVGTPLNVDGYGTATLLVTGTFVATIAFQGTIDGTTWFSVVGRDNAGNFASSTTSGDGNPHAWRFDTSGLTEIRSNITAHTSGSITVSGRAVPQTDTAKEIQAQLTGSNAINGNILSVPTPGTRVQLPNISCREVTIIGRALNAGNVYIGGNNVSSSVYGAELAAKDSITLTVTNADLIYIDADNAEEGISYVAV